MAGVTIDDAEHDISLISRQTSGITCMLSVASHHPIFAFLTDEIQTPIYEKREIEESWYSRQFNPYGKTCKTLGSREKVT